MSDILDAVMFGICVLLSVASYGMLMCLLSWINTFLNTLNDSEIRESSRE